MGKRDRNYPSYVTHGANMSMAHPFDITSYDIITITPAAPGAGAQLLFPIATNTRIKLVSIYFRFTTDANAANRVVRVGINDGTNNIITGITPILQTLSSVRDYFFSIRSGTDRELLGGAGSNEEWCAINSEADLRFGDSIITSINNIQAGDLVENIQIRYKQWIMPG